MSNKLIVLADSMLYRMRFLIVVLCAGLTCLLAVTRPAEAQSCSYLDSCGWGQCQDICQHITDYWGYFDPYCTFSNCCVQGPCYFTNQPHCYYCSSLDNSFCGYEHGCP